CSFGIVYGFDSW
nr:immunoglobulin heavy chain junction region [Macaca mulatta]MOY28790.1 immunoglobulin heavy chain junction region [Macaca mulatta]